MLLLGLGFLRSARSALLYHTTIYFKGWMYPWQAIIGGALSAAVGLFLIIHGIYRAKSQEAIARCLFPPADLTRQRSQPLADVWKER